MARFLKCNITVTGKCIGVQEKHYAQYKRLYRIFIFENSWEYDEDKTWEVYCQKVGYPMQYMFGLRQEDTDLESAFNIAWSNMRLKPYKEMFK